MAGHDPGATGFNPHATIPDAPPSIEWAFDLGSDDVNPAAPAIGPRVFVPASEWTGDGYTTTLYALDRESGEERWTAGLSYDVPGPPTYDPLSETVYAVSGQDNSNTGPGKGDVRAFDPATGERRWRTTLQGNLSGPPVVGGGLVLVRNASYGEAAVHAIDAETGEVLWRFRTGPTVHHSPTVGGDTVFVSREKTFLCAVALDDGSENWCTSIGGDETRPVVRDRIVYMGTQNGLVAVDATTGNRAWRWPNPGLSDLVAERPSVTTNPVVTRENVYAVGETRLVSLDRRSGAPEWQTNPDLIDTQSSLQLVGAANGVLVATNAPRDRKLGAFTRDGELLWSKFNSGAPMAVSGERLVACGSGVIQSFRIS